MSPKIPERNCDFVFTFYLKISYPKFEIEKTVTRPFGLNRGIENDRSNLLEGMNSLLVMLNHRLTGHVDSELVMLIQNSF